MTGPEASLDPVARQYDVVIAGARCAGAATALLLARGGARVLVVDPVPATRDALSTHALMRAGVLQLHRWGLLDTIRSRNTPPVRTTTFHYDGQRVAIPIKAGDGIDALYAPRRPVLDGVLVEAAVEAGAQVVYGLAVTDLLRKGDRVSGAVVEEPGRARQAISARLVIGADGLRSRVARLVRAPVRHRGRHATAVVYGHWPDPRPGEYHWYFGHRVTAGAISTNDGMSCVFAAVPPRTFRRSRQRGLDTLHQQVLGRLDPELARATSGPPEAGLRAFAGERGFVRQSVGPGWALVGDAGYYKDPATAHGITDALRDAELLARAFLRDEDHALREFETTRDNLTHGFFQATDRIASLAWSPAEVQSLHRDLSREMNRSVDAIRALDTPSTPNGPVPLTAR